MEVEKDQSDLAYTTTWLGCMYCWWNVTAIFLPPPPSPPPPPPGPLQIQFGYSIYIRDKAWTSWPISGIRNGMWMLCGYMPLFWIDVPTPKGTATTWDSKRALNPKLQDLMFMELSCSTRATYSSDFLDFCLEPPLASRRIHSTIASIKRKDKYFVFIIKASRTEQLHLGHKIYIPLSDEHYCPFSAMQKYVLHFPDYTEERKSTMPLYIQWWQSMHQAQLSEALTEVSPQGWLPSRTFQVLLTFILGSLLPQLILVW